MSLCSCCIFCCIETTTQQQKLERQLKSINWQNYKLRSVCKVSRDFLGRSTITIMVSRISWSGSSVKASQRIIYCMFLFQFGIVNDMISVLLLFFVITAIVAASADCRSLNAGSWLSLLHIKTLLAKRQSIWLVWLVQIRWRWCTISRLSSCDWFHLACNIKSLQVCDPLLPSALDVTFLCHWLRRLWCCWNDSHLR